MCLSAIAVVAHNCSGTVWSRTLLVTAVVTPYGLVPTVSVTGYATKAQCAYSFRGISTNKRGSGQRAATSEYMYLA